MRHENNTSEKQFTMTLRFTVKGWAAVLVIVLLLALPILLPGIQFAVAKGHRAELESLLASQVTFRQSQDVARIYEERKAQHLSVQQLAQRLEDAAEQMDVTVTRVQARGDFFGRVIARVDYTVPGGEGDEPAVRYFSIRYSWLVGWRLDSLREVDAGAFDRALWR